MESRASSSHPPQTLMIYDGLCGLCNHAVQWVIRHDHADRFRFAPQQSALATNLLARHGIDREAMLHANSVYLVLDAETPRERVLTESDVTANILLTVGGIWKVAGYLFGAVPRFLRDWAYRFVARNRYRFSRRFAACPLPSAATRAKFLA